MLLSFSVDYMRPMIEAGFRQYKGEVGDHRVKRQTIRVRGPRAQDILAQFVRDPIPKRHLHLWWKSRTKDRAFIGRVGVWTAEPITIRNLSGALSITTTRTLATSADSFAAADGFNDRNAFLNYFVPNPGDVFNGILYKW